MSPSALPIGIAVVRRGSDYLIRKRPPGSPMPGVWEFPGGKVENGETPEQTAVRECFEESGLVVLVERLLFETVHHYPHGRVHLHYFDCVRADDSDSPTDGSGFLWAPGATLPSLRFPEANEPVLKLLAERSESQPPSPMLGSS